MYALEFAGMTMSVPSSPQYGDNFEHANLIVLMHSLEFSDERCYVNVTLKQ